MHGAALQFIDWFRNRVEFNGDKPGTDRHVHRTFCVTESDGGLPFRLPEWPERSDGAETSRPAASNGAKIIGQA